MCTVTRNATEAVSESAGDVEEVILVVPMDIRSVLSQSMCRVLLTAPILVSSLPADSVPKLRIRTRQRQAMLGNRIVVAVDSWAR